MPPFCVGDIDVFLDALFLRLASGWLLVVLAYSRLSGRSQRLSFPAFCCFGAQEECFRFGIFVNAFPNNLTLRNYGSRSAISVACSPDQVLSGLTRLGTVPALLGVVT